MAKKLTPEALYRRTVRQIREQLHKGLDNVLDQHMEDFLKLLAGGYVLVATVRPFLETESGEASQDGVLPDPAIAGSIPALVDGAGNPVVKN